MPSGKPINSPIIRLAFWMLMLGILSSGGALAESKNGGKSFSPGLACRAVYGRAAYYNGGSWFRIWAVGTHHMYWVDESPEGERFEPLIKDFDHVVYADFVLCPTTRYKEGSMQGATIKSFGHVRVAERK